MSGVEEVLAMIDEAVEDWSVSGDAMRCNAPAHRPRWGWHAHELSEDLRGELITAVPDVTDVHVGGLRYETVGEPVLTEGEGGLTYTWVCRRVLE